MDDLAKSAVALGNDARIRAILDEVCRITGMGFAAVARVTEERWIAAQVLDRIEFGLDAGDELQIKTTLCNDIRQCGRMIVIDEVGVQDAWRTHPTPMMYGFESYASIPIVLPEQGFWGTLCAIDPEPRRVSAPEVVATLQRYADELAVILDARMPA